MFFQRDYILRMIEMMGDLMRRIRELLDDLQRMKLLDDVCHKHCGLSLEVAEKLTSGSLTDMLQPMPRLMLSEVLYAKAHTFTLLPEEKEALLHKSLHLLASLWQEGPLCELRAQRLLDMKAAVALLSPEELMDCARFFSEAERFDAMEDALFQAVEAAGPEKRPDLCQEGTALLAAAALASEQALAFAHTSRQELLEAAKELPFMGSPRP